MQQHVKVEELVTSAYAAASSLPPAEARLMRDVATRLSVTFVALTESMEQRKAITAERDEKNKLVVDLAVENAQIEQIPANNSERILLALDAFNTHAKTRPDMGMQQAFAVLMDVKSPATYAAIANIQAQGLDALVTECERQASAEGCSCNHASSLRVTKERACDFALFLRKGAAL